MGGKRHAAVGVFKVRRAARVGAGDGSPALPQLPNVDTSSPAPMPASLFSMLMRLEAAQVRLEAKVDLILDNQLQLLDLQMEDTTNPAT